MKLVTFNRAMAPHVAGETRLVSDEVAAGLESEGSIDAGAPDWPPQAPVAAVVDAAASTAPRNRLRMSRGRDLMGQTYLTK